MKISRQKFAIATSNFPLEFDDGYGNMINEVEHAYLYDSKDQAQYRIDKTFNEPDKYMVLCVKITLEF